MHRLLLIACTLMLVAQLRGQAESTFHPPMKIPLYLSGNFGEIRTDHLHSGIDIKTQGSIGHHVFAIDAGYVSRIKVQANGYGKSIYVTHPNGFTSVYGHLDRYRDDIAAYVKKVQYRRKSHVLDLYLDAATFPLTRGEFIAYSGNTAGSTGPHLHFEIRKAATQEPTNVLSYGFDIYDDIAPRFHSVYIYGLDTDAQVNGSNQRFSSRVVKDKGVYTLPWGTKLEATGRLGISVEVFDYLNGASNRCGVYSLEFYLDEQLMYRHVMDAFSFNETRYVNARIDYPERIRSGTKAHRLHRLPNDRLRLYAHLEDNGELHMKENRSYQVRILARDVAGNESELRFKLSGARSGLPAVPPDDPGVQTISYDQAHRFESGPVSVEIPKNALYQDLEFTYDSAVPAQGSLSHFYHICSEEVPVHTSYTLSIKGVEVDPALRPKLLLVTLDEEGNLEEAGGSYANGKVSSKLRNFGKFAIGIDTIAPEIKPAGGTMSGDMSGKKQLKFLITDELSGIETYEGYIDGKWVLFEYDRKNDLLFHALDAAKITPKSAHELELYVSDAKGNTRLFRSSFIW